MGYPNAFIDFYIDNPQTWNQFQRTELTSKSFGDHNIDVEVEACGVCGSDVHTVRGGWGRSQGYELVDHAVPRGLPRRGHLPGRPRRRRRAGLGASLECDLCRGGQENYCAELADTCVFRLLSLQGRQYC